MDEFEHCYTLVNGIRMHYVTAGSGPLVLLLHGFPEFWYSWRKQIPALSPFFQIVAPDLRGYNETDKPDWGYEPDVLVADIVGLLDSLGQRTAVIVGHDWGGALAWLLAASYPQRVQRLVVLNCPHPALFAQAIRRNPSQMVRSWYMGFFQLPWLPEALFRANDYAAIDQTLRGTAVSKDAFSDDDIAAYKDAISKPGALRAAINYYRAAARSRTIGEHSGTRIEAPTLLIWGEQDVALGKELTYGTERLVADLRIRYIPDAGHWVHQERSADVNRFILEFLRSDER